MGHTVYGGGWSLATGNNSERLYLEPPPRNLPHRRRLGQGKLYETVVVLTMIALWTRVARWALGGPEPEQLGALIAQTLLLYVILVGGLAILLRRITRPLAALEG